MFGHPFRQINTAAWQKKRRGQRGAFVVELLIMAALALIICTILAYVVSASWTMGKITGNKAVMQTQTRRAMTLFQQDLQGSAFALPTYNTYSAGPATLILQAPSYNASFQQISGSNDTIIYRLVGASAPYTLNRQVISAAGSARPSVADTIVVKNVASLRFTYLYDQKATSTGASAFSLTLTNLYATPSVASQLGLSAPVVLVNGAVVSSGVTLTGTSATITPAPASGASVDLIFPVDPSASVSQASVTAVFATLTATVTDVSIKNAATQTFVLTGGGVLRNH